MEGDTRSYGGWARLQLHMPLPPYTSQGTVTTPALYAFGTHDMTSGSLPNLKPGERLVGGPGLVPLSSRPGHTVLWHSPHQGSPALASCSLL